MAALDRPDALQSPASYWHAYRSDFATAMAGVDGTAIDAAAALIEATLRRDGWIFSCGNGGSSSISNHLQCDFAKGVRAGTSLKPKVMSLPANLETSFAIANDISFVEVFSHQLEGVGRPQDLVITISSSGNSENVVRALDWARANAVQSISLTGFDGGRTAKLADVNIHVPSHNYGVVEDIHQSIMHVLSQYLRRKHTPPGG